MINKAGCWADRLAISNHTLCLPPGQHPFDKVKDVSIYSELLTFPAWRLKLYELDQQLHLNKVPDDNALYKVAKDVRKTCNEPMDLRRLLRATKSADLYVRVDINFIKRWGLHDLRVLLSKPSSKTQRVSKFRKKMSALNEITIRSIALKKAPFMQRQRHVFYDSQSNI